MIEKMIEELIEKNKCEEKEKELSFQRVKERVNMLADHYSKLRDYINEIDNFDEFKRRRYILEERINGNNE
jgi:hypothetical protein